MAQACGQASACHGQGNRAGISLAVHVGVGEYAAIGEIATAERINETYVGRMPRLTLLAPDIVETILIGGSRRDWSWTA